MTKAQEEVQKARLAEKAKVLSAYHTLFNVVGGEAAKVVLADLAWEGYADRSTAALDNQGRVDSHQMAIYEGMRSLYAKLLLRIREGAKVGAPTETPRKAESILT